MSLTDEMLLVTRLKSLKIVCNAFDGLTTFDQRKEKIRGAVKQLPKAVYGTRGGKPYTLEQEFERIYREAP